MNVTPYQQRFILHFGEMGSRWGINRTVGQIYALLFVNEQPVNADQIADKLGMSRSNVSMGLKELQSWELVRLQHVPGDRKEYFSAPDDVWSIFQSLAKQRRRREVDPTLSMLRDALLDPPSDDDDAYARSRLTEMLEMIEMLTDWFSEVQRLERATLIKLMRLGGGVRRVLDAGGRLRKERAAKRGDTS